MKISKDIRPSAEGLFPKLDTGVHGVALANGSRFDIGIIHCDDGVFIAVERHGAYRFTNHAVPSYVGSKLDLMEGDAENMADLINDQIGAAISGERYGEYCAELTAK